MLKGKGIISKLQKKVLNSLKDIPDSSYFYLTGGTALAEFYFGHRKSYDLDIFTAQKGLILPFSRIVEEELKKRKFSTNVIRRFSSFVEFEISKENEIIKVQLALDSPFRFEEPVDSDLGLKINDYKDITVDKLLAFFGRVEPRDAVDLYFILEKENFWELADLSKQKDPGFDLYWMATALEKVKDFPDTISRWPVEMLIDIDIKKLKNKFSSFTMDIMERLRK
ncbi:MAG: nucleotidyl transferase AbiEii/AbiGii toxin family protein [Actinobacteria bacterium]|nr:nucleotidyl transferase AbiEii/AbiGii toxin family protein [Actinomycetota bacterium]MCG2788694.1 nucleotidyl transferase AbiEii/AbiGii toxin family protein [Actinomycetes bacterium]MCG2790667.1 nucleotidyl transferase AbiEii/AbiGii toxin family protein [Actinomycetes bacterium]